MFTSLPFYSNAEEIAAEYVEGEILITAESPIKDTDGYLMTMSAEDTTLIDFDENDISDIEELEIDNGDKTTTYLAEVDGDVLDICKELEKLPGVQYAEPNYIYHTTEFTMPNEVTYPSTIYNDNQKWYMEDIMHIPSAWEEFETTGENVVIAVIDNGFKIDATEFPDNLWTDENGNHGWNTHENNADISPIYKDDGTMFNNTQHGTNVAGVIGMRENTGNGVGAAYNAELMLINAASFDAAKMTEPSFTTQDIIEAIDYAVNNGADIINMSLGGPDSAQQLENAVDNAYNAGVAVIAAAGNSGIKSDTKVYYPAGYDNAIGVMAIERMNTGQLAYFSNYNGKEQAYDVAAPGVLIVGCACETGKLTMMSGTSQATPLVAACAAMYLSKYPDKTVAELYEAIRNSPTKTVTSNSETETRNTYYYKSLDAVELLSYGKVTPEINFNLLTSVTHDPYRNYIYGLDEGYTDITSYVTVTEGSGTFELVPTENGNGTGALFNVYDIYGDLYKSYTIIIFGDLNGDAYADGQDAVIISAIIDSPSSYSEPFKYAADVDFDDIVNENDYFITAEYAIKNDMIFQTR